MGIFYTDFEGEHVEMVKAAKGSIAGVLSIIDAQWRKVHESCNFRPAVYIEAFLMWDVNQGLSFSKAAKARGSNFFPSHPKAGPPASAQKTTPKYNGNADLITVIYWPVF